MPVLMLTGSYDPHNIELCKQLGCNEYCIKPIDNVFAENVKKISFIRLRGISFHSQSILSNNKKDAIKLQALTDWEFPLD